VKKGVLSNPTTSPKQKMDSKQGLGGEEDTWDSFRNAVWDKALKLAALPSSAQVGVPSFSMRGEAE